MPARSNADETYGADAFLVREAVAAGYGHDVFMHARWHRPFAGVRVLGRPAATLQERALHYVPRLRAGDRFSHATALALLGCPIWVARDAPVDISSSRSRGRVIARGVAGHRHDDNAAVLRSQSHGARIAIAPPLVAVQQAACTLPFRELVVALDHLLNGGATDLRGAPLVTEASLAAYAERATGRGAKRFREAARLARVGAQSRMETPLRLAAVRVGMTDLETQGEIRDARGVFIGLFDLVDRTTRSLLEFDGEQHHFSRKQRRRDPRRLQAARDADWRVLVFYSEQLTGNLLQAGREMLRFCGRAEQRVPVALSSLIDEVAVGPTESAIPLAAPHERYQ